MDTKGGDDELDQTLEAEGESDTDDYELDATVIKTLNDARRMVYQLLVWQDISWGM